ncbi:hypothetical protein BH10ACT3_BH10ACT3_20110 [soil metagenome]
MIDFREAQRLAFRQLNRVVEPAARSAWTGPLPIGAGLVMLESTGRRSGLTRSNPLLSLRVGNTVVAGTVRPSSDWIANVEAAPRNRLWIDGRAIPSRAVVARLPIASVARFELDR